MSLWPPPTTWYTTIGFRPITATAKTARSGRTRLTNRHTTNSVPRLAIAASIWKPRIWLVTLRSTPVVTTDSHVNKGPYTDGVPRQPGQVYSNNAFPRKSLGVMTYGFAP